MNMSKLSTGFTLSALIAASLCGYQPSAYAAPVGLMAPSNVSPAYKFSGPFMHKNLSVFLIHGKDAVKGQNFLTLQEALQQKKVVILETGNVNQLKIQNLGDAPVFIQGGDIIKGGRQDRTLQKDMILPPKSGILPIDVFCVEHGRWSGRGGESATHFSGSTNGLVSKDLKYAAKVKGDQGDVWSQVGALQSKAAAKAMQIARVAPESIAASASPSSLELTLENKKLKDLTTEYVKDLSKLVDGKNDVIGYAFAINGKMNSADVYATNGLFKKLWPKLLNSTAVEAFSELENGKKIAPVTEAQVRACMEDAESAKPSNDMIAGRARVKVQETAKNVVIKTSDTVDGNYSLHTNYLSK